MFTRLLDNLKNKNITTCMTSLLQRDSIDSQFEVSSMMDNWIIIRYQRQGELRKRFLYIHKARGIAHSQKTAELIFSHNGPRLNRFLSAEDWEEISCDS